jgi:hypothetical protein
MVEIAEPEENAMESDWTHLLDNYQRLETAVRDEDSDPELIGQLVDQSQRIIVRLMEWEKSPEYLREVASGQALADAQQQLERLITLIQREMAKVSQRMTVLKTGRSAMNAYQRPRLGMGFTEGKFFDNKK